MFAKARKKGTIRFALTPAKGARKVCVAGSFNGWEPVPMAKQKDGLYVRNLPAAPGGFEYKFVVDGQWILDPDNCHWAANGLGVLNSVGSVE